MKPDFERIARGLCSEWQNFPSTVAALRAAYDAGLERAAEIAEETEEDGEPKYNRACYDIATAIRAEKEKTDDCLHQG